MNSFRSSLNKGAGSHPSSPLMPGKKPVGANETNGLGSVPVTRETVRNVNHRDDDRHRLQAEHATLKVGRRKHRVDLVNLSGGGAMVRADVKLEMWQKVHLGLRLNIYNLTNEVYIRSINNNGNRYNPGPPVSALLTASAKF